MCAAGMRWLLASALRVAAVTTLNRTPHLSTPPAAAQVHAMAGPLRMESALRCGRTPELALKPWHKWSARTLSFLLRVAYVWITVAIAVVCPFFGSVAGLIGAVAFWPLQVCAAAGQAGWAGSRRAVTLPGSGGSQARCLLLRPCTHCCTPTTTHTLPGAHAHPDGDQNRGPHDVSPLQAGWVPAGLGPGGAGC